MPDSVASVSVYNAATCQTYCIGFSLQPCHLPDLLHCFQFRAGPLARLYFIGFRLQTLLHWFQFTAVPLVRLYCICSTLQPSHRSDFIALVSVGSPDTYQFFPQWFQSAFLLLARLFHWFQFTALPFARLYHFSINLQRCHLQTLLHCFQFTVLPVVRLYALVSVCSRAAGQTFFALVPVYSHTNGQTLLLWFELAVPTLVRLSFMISVCSPAACQVGLLPLARFDLSRFSLQPAYICTKIYSSESCRVVWLCPLGP